MPGLKLEPYHEPIGLSPEVYSTSRRWLVPAATIIAVLAVAVLIALRLG